MEIFPNLTLDSKQLEKLEVYGIEPETTKGFTIDGMRVTDFEYLLPIITNKELTSFANVTYIKTRYQDILKLIDKELAKSKLLEEESRAVPHAQAKANMRILKTIMEGLYTFIRITGI